MSSDKSTETIMSPRPQNLQDMTYLKQALVRSHQEIPGKIAFQEKNIEQINRSHFRIFVSRRCEARLFILQYSFPDEHIKSKSSRSHRQCQSHGSRHQLDQHRSFLQIFRQCCCQLKDIVFAIKYVVVLCCCYYYLCKYTNKDNSSSVDGFR